MDSLQDWTTVQIKRRNTAPKAPAQTAARVEATRLVRLETEDVVSKKKSLTSESRRDLAAARIAVKKTQRDVDKELAFPPNTIRDFEAGTAVPSGAQISALQRYFAASKLVLRTS